MMRRGAQDIDERSGTARCRPRQFSGVRSAVLRGLGAAASGGPQTRAARALRVIGYVALRLVCGRPAPRAWLHLWGLTVGARAPLRTSPAQFAPRARTRRPGGRRRAACGGWPPRLSFTHTAYIYNILCMFEEANGRSDTGISDITLANSRNNNKTAWRFSPLGGGRPRCGMLLGALGALGVRFAASCTPAA